MLCLGVIIVSVSTASHLSTDRLGNKLLGIAASLCAVSFLPLLFAAPLAVGRMLSLLWGPGQPVFWDYEGKNVCSHSAWCSEQGR